MNLLLEKNKPLLIYGKPGTGKTHIALELLKDTILLHLDSLYLKDIKDIKKYIIDRIKKRNVTLMFQESKETRGLLIDDLHTFHKYDKNSFNKIIDFLKTDIFYGNKIIIICDTSFLKNKYINKLKFKRFHLNYDYNTYYKICYHIAKDKKFNFSLDELDNKIYKSDYNFHKFISDSKYNTLTIRDNFDGVEEYTKELCINKYNLNDIFRCCSGDEKIILLNMMENISNNNIKIHRFINNFNDKDIFLKEYELLNIPIYMIHKNINLKKHNIIYNRYISKNMITYKNYINYNKYLFYLIDTYIRYNKYKDIILLYDKIDINYHKDIYEKIYNIKVLFQ
jgi:hypothetical protein